jgi:hypothetical protein
MALTASWLRFAPRQFARGRDYEVSCTTLLAAPVATAFTIMAEGALRAGSTTSDAVWQFAALSPEGPVVLARCDFEVREGARARVIWALALPLDYLQSSSFALYSLVEHFAALGGDAGGDAAPEPPALKAQRVKTVAPEATTLLAKYIEAGSVRVAADMALALKLFCQTLELLPPGDRLRVSFSTAAGLGRTFEVDPAAVAPEALVAGEEARAIATLWSMFRYGVAAPVQRDLSLTRNPVEWLRAMLATDDVPAKFRGLSKLVLERLDPPQHATTFALLRRALELQLMHMSAQLAARALARLEAEGYFGPDYGTPPIWIARLAVELNLLTHLPPALVQKILRPGSLAFLLSALQRPSSSARVQCWVAALQRPGLLDAAARRELLAACGTAWRDLVGSRRRAFGHADLARSVALLALYEHCRGAPARAGASS